MDLLMQRLLRDMEAIGDVSFAEPQADAPPQAAYVGQVPMAIRQIAAVLQMRLEELRKEVFYFIHDASSAPPDTIDRLRRYVDFIKSALIHETEELVPEVAIFRRQGGLVTFHRKWTIYVLEGVLPRNEGEPMDTIAELVAEELLKDIEREKDKAKDAPKDPPPPTDEPPDSAPPPLRPSAPHQTGDIAGQMEKMNWFDRALGIVQRGQNKPPDDEKR